jgi:23S rRNA (uridine2552-2'-O)-methyltransferase
MAGRGSRRSASKGTRGKSGSPTGRNVKTRVKTAKRRSLSSTRWLARQLNDPYVAEAKKRGLRSRAAFKLAQLDDKYRFLKPGARILDLGAAPGGWCEVAQDRCGPKAKIVGIDLLEMQPLPGVTLIQMDFLDEDAPARLREALGGPADAVLSDMAAPATGHAKTDHLRIMALAEAAYDFAEEVLAPGGTFVAKVFQGGTEADLLARLKRNFTKVAHMKPAASRPESAETYLVAIGFRGDRSDIREER